MNHNILLEHELYPLLTSVGIETPSWHFLSRNSIDDDSSRCESMVREFLERVVADPSGENVAGRRVVVKVAAREVAHKAAAGGVAVETARVDALVASVRDMHGRFSADSAGYEGVLLVEYVDHSDHCGEELLLGVQRTVEFGPILSIAPGGADTEVLTRSGLTPLYVSVDPEASYEQIERTVRATCEAAWPGRLWNHRKKGARVAQASRAAVGLVQLMREHPGMEEMEINPAAWNGEERLLALDALAFGPEPEAEDDAKTLVVREPDTRGLDALLAPRTIAVVGVSNAEKPGTIIARSIAATAASDSTELYCVNPRGGEVELAGERLPLYRSLGDIPTTLDLVVVTVPAAATLPVVADAAAAGARSLLVIPGGFSEFSGDRDAETHMAHLAKEAGMRVLGPNCLGFINRRRSLSTFFIPERKLPPVRAPRANVAIISQSGALALTTLTHLAGVADPLLTVTYGNGIDVEPGDILRHLTDDKEVDAVGIYVEGFAPGGGERLAAAIRRSPHRTVVYIAGRTPAGQRATATHTASIAGPYAVSRSVMTAAGATVAESIEEFLRYLTVFSLLAEKEAGRGRLAVVANAGYEKTCAADNIGALQLAELDEATREALTAMLPNFVNPDALLDLTPMAGDEVYCRAVETLLESPSVDMVVVSVVPHSVAITTTDEESSSGTGLGARLASIARRSSKPVVFSVPVRESSRSVYTRLCDEVRDAGLPITLDAGSATHALDLWAARRRLGASEAS